MSDNGKKTKSENLLDSAMQELVSDEALMQFNEGEDLMQFNDGPDKTMGLLGEGIGEGEASDPSLLDSEAPSGLDMSEPRSEQKSEPKSETKSEAELRTQIVSSNDEVELEPTEQSASESESYINSVSADQSTVVVKPGEGRQYRSAEESTAHTKNIVGFDQAVSAVPAVLASSLSENQVIQAENLKMAQNRISELEKELEFFRSENEALSSTSAFSSEQINEFNEKIQRLEVSKSTALQQYQSELAIYKDTVSEKDFELNKLRQKVVELEGRLQKDLRKIRVRERELANRLEIVKLEKEALLKSKDETILDLKSKLDQLSHDLKNSMQVQKELNHKMNDRDQNRARTARTLRLALTSLEVEESSPEVTSAVPLKKVK